MDTLTASREMHPNSIRAFTDLQKTITNKEFQVLEIYRDGNLYTDQEVAMKLGWPINRVTGRVGGLLLKDRIREVGDVMRNGRKCRQCQFIDITPKKLF